MARTNIDQLGEAVMKDLTIYSNKVTRGIKREARLAIKELAKETKATAPVGKRRKHYKNQIRFRKLSENDRGAVYQWYVQGKDYRLSHLLENGHALRNGGRSTAFGFIHRAEVSVLENFNRAVEEVVRNGR